MKTKTLRHVTLFALAFCFMVNSIAMVANAVEVEPRYTGIYSIKSTIDISPSGMINCSGSVIGRSGYTIELTVELQRFDRDWETIETWGKTSSGVVSLEGIYFVPKNNKDYQVVTTAIVKDSSGKIVESPSKESEVMTY